MHVVVAVFQQRVVQQGDGTALIPTEAVAADQVERGSLGAAPGKRFVVWLRRRVRAIGKNDGHGNRQ
jgi:hypothetical protein